MRNVRIMTLSECCEIVSGATPKTSEDKYWHGEIPWTTPKDLSNLKSHYLEDTPRKITKLGLDSCGASVLPSGSVLFSSRAPIGHVAINSVPMATNQGFKSFIPKVGVIDAKFLFHWLKKNRNYLESLGNGATFKEVSKTTVSRIEIALPPIDDQRRIAALLDEVDALRAKRRDALRMLGGLTESIFFEMFGTLEKAYYGLPLVQLRDVTTRITDGTHLTPKFLNSGIPFIFVKNFHDGQVNFETDKFISEDEHTTLYKRCPVEKGDVLYTTVGATYGQAAIVGDFVKFAFQRHVAHLKPDVKKILPEFLGEVMKLSLVKKQADRWARGAAQPTLNLTELRNFEIPLPSFERQHEFVKKAFVISKMKNAMVASSSKLDILFESLQSRAFLGEL